MTRMVVARTGTGPLHIAEPDGTTWRAVCGKTLRLNVTTWKAGHQAWAVWQLWRTCPQCADIDRMWGRSPK